jgi:penicillin-binding protein 1C
VIAEAPREPAATDPLRPLFPPPGALLAAAAGPVTLRTAGGRRSLAFLMDGAPVPHEPARREAAWEPTGRGFYRVTVLDAAGASASAMVRIRAAEAAEATVPTLSLQPLR